MPAEAEPVRQQAFLRLALTLALRAERPSARLPVDVAEGVVVRSYVDGDGRTVTETWIRKEGGR